MAKGNNRLDWNNGAGIGWRCHNRTRRVAARTGSVSIRTMGSVIFNIT